MNEDLPAGAQHAGNQRRETTGAWTGEAALGREAIRARLKSIAPPSSVSGVPAAVLIALLDYPDDPRIILTERTASLRNHAAQVSFPGGRIEESDPDPAAAALREAWEEIRLPPERVELLGCLQPHETVSGFFVYPFVGWIEHPVDLLPDSHEVAEVFEVPLSFVLDPANHRWESKYLEGSCRTYYVFSYPKHRIWGATAEMLVDLAGVLTA